MTKRLLPPLWTVPSLSSTPFAAILRLFFVSSRTCTCRPSNEDSRLRCLRAIDFGEQCLLSDRCLGESRQRTDSTQITRRFRITLLRRRVSNDACIAFGARLARRDILDRLGCQSIGRCEPIERFTDGLVSSRQCRYPRLLLSTLVVPYRPDDGRSSLDSESSRQEKPGTARDDKASLRQLGPLVAVSDWSRTTEPTTPAPPRSFARELTFAVLLALVGTYILYRLQR